MGTHTPDFATAMRAALRESVDELYTPMLYTSVTSAAGFASLMLADLMTRAGVPKGVFNVVHGDREAVDAILAHPNIQAISFVGSTPIAEYIYSTGTANGKRVQALGGAKNHAIIMPDADMDQAADALVGAGYGAAVACGDIDGDGIGDVLVGDPDSDLADNDAAAIFADDGWATLLQETRLEADQTHDFEDEIIDCGVASHVRMSIYPDGGVSRLRLFGRVSAGPGS